jgi:hypothetical protein
MRFSHEKMSLEKTHVDKIGQDGYALRHEKLKELSFIEDIIREESPLPCSYDIGSNQPPHFTEFTYTEYCFGVYLKPQSQEAACEIINSAVSSNPKLDFSVLPETFDKNLDLKVDKYKLSEKTKLAERVVFLPGSNMLYKMVSREVLARMMFENDDIYLKLHPFTHDEDVYRLGAQFGYDRLLPRKESGVQYLKDCIECWTASNSELSTYAAIYGKRLGNVSSFFWEARGAYYPIFNRLLKTGTNKFFLVNQLFNCEFSGILNPLFYDAHEIRHRVRAFFELAMEIRKKNKPLAAPVIEIQQPNKQKSTKKKEQKKLDEF